MDANQITKQMLELNKAAFDNAFNSVAAVQDQAQNMISLLVEQTPWFPEEGKKAIKQWGNPYMKGRETLKAAVDEGYKKAEDLFARF
jgi:hypothetical protein